jgi:hypothetical protein
MVDSKALAAKDELTALRLAPDAGNSDSTGTGSHFLVPFIKAGRDMAHHNFAGWTGQMDWTTPRLNNLD